MVVKIMRWRPWPPLISRKYDVKIAVRKLECGDWVPEGSEKGGGGALAVEIRWKGPRISLGSFRRTVKRNCTREEAVKRVDERENGGVLMVEWDEEFQSVCGFSSYKDSVFHPWEMNFTILHGQNQCPKNKVSVVGTLNLAEYASSSWEQGAEVEVPLTVSNGTVECRPMLYIFLSLHEFLPAPQDPPESVQTSIVPHPSPPALVKIFTEYVSARRAKKACLDESSNEERPSSKSDEAEFSYPFDSDSLDEFEGGGDSEVAKEYSAVRKSFSHGTLAAANGDEGWVYYSNRRRLEVGNSHEASVERPPVQVSRRSLLPWRKRKLSFRSPKAKGEPLLKKGYGDEGGDDIDFDRRQLSSDESGSFELQKTDEEQSTHNPSTSEFGDDCFTVGAWEQKEITSRDGLMKIRTDVFFASIDQRSERAAGESACTALVAVIADWLQSNLNLIPVRSQFDALIRDGSFEWRSLCENEAHRARFPDGHFDLDTVLQSEKRRDLCVVPEKSFVGFFHPEGMEEGSFDFLHGAMSFDSIWSEILAMEGGPVFIVSWNDHFFVLKVEADTYYVIDTLGERLHEGCRQAYVLKFDRETSIRRVVPGGDGASEPAPGSDESEEATKVEEVICRGKECCKEYIKSFLAAIPIRELQADMKKGLKTSTAMYQRLQIEFHFTELRGRRVDENAPLPVDPSKEDQRRSC